MRALSAVIVLFAGAAAAARPPSARSFSAGLEARAEAPAGSVALLRTPPRARVFVPGGTFAMGSGEYEAALGRVLCEKEPLGTVCPVRGLPDDLFAYEGPAHVVTVSPFHLDRTEVTVDAYARCVGAGACSPPGFPALDPRFARPDLPVTHVAWDDAARFCAYAGGRLPTEAEWEIAARGTQARAFPWGNVYNPHLANHGSLALDPTDASDGFAGLAPVGSYPNGATPLGLVDLSGNVSEWVEDRMDERPDGTFAGYPPKPQTNPVVTKGSHHVARGGSHLTGAHALRATARAPMFGEIRRADVGFRCAYSSGAR